MVIIFVLFWFLLIVSIVLFVLAIQSGRRYRRTEDKDALKLTASLVLAAVIIISVTLVGAYPAAVYDSVRYQAYISSQYECTMIIPFPNEKELKDEMEVYHPDDLQWEIVTSEKGRGLKVTFNGSFNMEGTYLTRVHRVDYDAELRDGDSYWIHLESENESVDPIISWIKIVHQSPTDFHSKQIVSYRYPLELGWNKVEYVHYAADS